VKVSETIPPHTGKDTVAIDFDRTCVDWQPLDFYHEVAIPGAKEAAEELRATGKTIAIFTSRLDPTWLLQSGNDYETQYRYVKSTLTRLGIPFDYITGNKVVASKYIDDAAITFDGSWDRAMASYRSGISPYDLAWAAGLFEGEGSISFSGSRNGVHLQLSMTDKDVIDKFARVVGAGKVYGPEVRGPSHWKSIYHWSLRHSYEVSRIIRMLIPFLGERRAAKAHEALVRLESNRGPWADMTHCLSGHPYTDENTYVDRASKRRNCRTCSKVYRARYETKKKEYQHVA